MFTFNIFMLMKDFLKSAWSRQWDRFMSSNESVFSSKREKRSLEPFSFLLRLLFRRFRMRSEAQRRCNVDEATHLVVGGVLAGEEIRFGLEEFVLSLRLKFLLKKGRSRPYEMIS